MPVKKKPLKKTSEKEKVVTPEPPAPVVRQVVEVVEEVDESAPPQSTHVTIDVETAPAETLVDDIKEEIKTVQQEATTPLSEMDNVMDLVDELPEANTPQPVAQTPANDVLTELFTEKETAVYPDISMHTKKTSKMSLALWVVLVLGVATFVSGSLLFFLKGGFSNGMITVPIISQSPTPTPEPTLAATPTQEPVDREGITIEVLNGGGVPGAAGKMKSFLESKGYTVTKTGNASAYTYDETTIVVKAGKTALSAQLKDDLSAEYTAVESAEDLPDSATVDAQVIVGK